MNTNRRATVFSGQNQNKPNKKKTVQTSTYNTRE